MKDNTCILECGSIYHIFNRGNNNKDKIFIENENYEFFLRKFIEYISPISEVFCYCLIPNHFHFLLQIKEYHQINEVIPCLKEEVGKSLQDNSATFSTAIRRLSISDIQEEVNFSAYLLNE